MPLDVVLPLVKAWGGVELELSAQHSKGLKGRISDRKWSHLRQIFACLAIVASLVD